MDTIPFDLPDSLVESPPRIFSEVKYTVEGTVDEKITKLLDNGGAKKLSYTTISTTHVLVGEGANEVALNEAEEVFDIPLVQPRWVAFCVKKEALLPLNGFEAQKKLFNLIRICTSGIKGEDLNTLWALVTNHGGKISKNLTNKCSHLIINTCESPKYKVAKDNHIKTVCCDWVTECIKANQILDEVKFDPQFLIKPDAIKKIPPPLVTMQPSSAAEATKTSKYAISRSATKSATSTSPVRPQGSTILQVQLSGNTTPTGPRGRGARQPNAQPPKPQGTTQIRAHRPLLVNSQPAQLPKSVPPPPPIATGSASPRATVPATNQQQHATSTSKVAVSLPSKTPQQQRPVPGTTTPATAPAVQQDQQQVPPIQQQEPQQHVPQPPQQSEQQVPPPQLQQQQSQINTSTISQPPPPLPSVHPQQVIQQQSVNQEQQPLQVTQSLQPPQVHLHQQLQQTQLHEQVQYQQQTVAPQPPTHLQTALSQPSPQQSAQNLQSQLVQQQQQQQQQQMQSQMQMQQHISLDSATSQPQFVSQQNQIQYQQSQMLPNQQMQYVHHQTLQPPTSQHPQSPVGVLGHPNHSVMQQGMQQQLQTRAPQPQQQGHPMHLQSQQQPMHSQVQLGQQPHPNVQGLQGMQFQQGQPQHPQQMQIHGLQPGNLQSQQVLQSQKSPIPPQSQPMQNLGNAQQQHQAMLSQQQQHSMMAQQPQMGIPPQHQSFQMAQNQIHSQQMQNQQQQFTLPSQPKTPPHQVHPQLINQQQLQQGQVVMRPPQSPQQQQQPVHFQILQQPQNRLQVVMGSAGNQGQFQQGQTPTSNAQTMGMANQQQMFRQQQPLQPGPTIPGANKPQGQMFHQSPPRQPQGIIQMQQQQQQPNHQQQMQTSQSGHVPGTQPILSPQQQLQPKQFPEVPGQQVQQQGGQYNVVIHQGQQFTQMNQRGHVQLTQRHPGQPGQPQQIQMGQKVGQFPVGVAARLGVNQWTQQQQLEIYRQIQLDPNIKARWAQMDTQQRQLLVQKLAQRQREDQLRKEMMLRQQQLNQQNAAMQGQQQGQITQQPQIPSSVPGSPHFHGAQQGQPGMVQQPLNQGGEPHMVVAHQGSPTLVSQPSPSPLMSQASNAQSVQQLPGNAVLASVPQQAQQQQMLMSNHNMIPQQQNHQKLITPQSPSPTQKFPPPSPLQQLQTRPVMPGQQAPQQGQTVRTQHVFTPQVGQQQRMVNVQHVVVQQQQQPGQPQTPGVQQQQPRFPPSQIVLQQLPGPPPPGQQQKVTLLQGSPQQQQPPQGQWLPGSQPQQRLGSPTQGSPQFTPRMQGSPDQQRSSPGQVWNTRQHSPLATPSTVGSPGTPTSNPPYVQMVNSKTKTALANLLNNRLQGNSTGTDSSVTQSTASSISAMPASTVSTSTTLTMCSPTSPSQTPPAFPSQSQQLPLQHPVSRATSQSLNVISQRTLSNLTNNSKTIHQVGSYPGTAVTRPSSLSQPTTTLSLPTARTAFYGHEPGFKAPTNGFLLGCVFWAAQPIPSLLSHWKETVEYNGGEVSEQYNSAKVTHVICYNQKFTEFQQVIREGKRVVTMNWLSDTLIRKVMAPPFYAIHLPTSFTEDAQPLKGQVFSITGFEKEDRQRVVKMLQLCGADCTMYFTKINKGLVSCRSEGQKYAKAREWKVPIINIQFLNELLLGNHSCLQMIHAPKYQHFSLEQPFRFDINIAPHLMAAWKNPVRVNNEILEKFKSSKRPLDKPIGDHDRVKRMKYEKTEKSQMLYLDEAVIGDEAMEVDKAEDDLKPDTENKRPPVIMFTGFSEKFVSLATEKIKVLGGRVSTNIKEVTHVVSWEIVTTKLYSALSVVKFIVNASWIRDSIKAKRFLDEKPFCAKVESFEKFHKVGISDVLKLPDRHLLFKGMTFYITPGITGTFRTDLVNIIETAGGQVDKIQNSMTDIKSRARRNPRKYVIITNLEDYHHFSEIFSCKPTKPLSIFTVMFIYKCIADQKVDLGPLPNKKNTAAKLEPSSKNELTSFT